MRRARRTYESPAKAWQKSRITKEKELMREYGLKSKKELWKVEGKVRRFRREARELTASFDEQQKKEFIRKLNSLGLIEKNAKLDDVLDLEVYNILNRRLQTFITKKGFANSVKGARQLITHGHIFVNDRKVTVPGYLVKKDEEDTIKKI